MLRLVSRPMALVSSYWPMTALAESPPRSVSSLASTIVASVARKTSVGTVPSVPPGPAVAGATLRASCEGDLHQDEFHAGLRFHEDGDTHLAAQFLRPVGEHVELIGGQ